MCPSLHACESVILNLSVNVSLFVENSSLLLMRERRKRKIQCQDLALKPKGLYPNSFSYRSCFLFYYFHPSCTQIIDALIITVKYAISLLDY